jgi:cytochrome c oxidase subunit IV
MDSHSAEHHADSGIKVYLVVFIALSIFTILSFVFNDAVRSDTISAHTGFALILGVAVCKAFLVGCIFMHLKFDWGRVYFMIVPALILGVLMLIVLMPDIVLGWRQ